MNLAITPYVKAGVVELGASRNTTRRALHPIAPVPFRKASTSVALADAYNELGIHVHFDALDKCEAIEVWEPTNVTLDGEALIGRELLELLTIFRRRDPALEEDETGFTSPGLGVAVYAQNAAEPDARVESVLVFTRGYFDS